MTRWLHSPRWPQPLDVTEIYERSLEDSQRHRDKLAEVERCCLFIGYPRSGHSLVGSLLDAHPDMVIAHELDALGLFEAGFSIPQIYSLILENDRAFTAGGREWEGYRYLVPGQWQGRFRRLRVLGDKNGGLTSRRLAQSPKLLAALREAVGELKLVHVVRHPYDNISTMFRRSQYTDLRQAIELYFSLCRTVAEVMAVAAVETVHLEDLVASPNEVLSRLTRFLGVDADAGYLESCAQLIWSAPRQTRGEVGWSSEEKALVRAGAAAHPFLERYRFDE